MSRTSSRCSFIRPLSPPIEPPILELVTAKIVEHGKPWRDERLPLVADRIRVLLRQLSARLGEADWLDVRAARAG